MQLTYDPQVDALMIVLADQHNRSARARVISRNVATGIYIDEDTKGNLLGIEILDASTRIPRRELHDIPSPQRFLSLAQAAKQSRLSADTLRRQINNGRLKGQKHGRDWTVSETDLINYLESRDARGRPSRLDPARRHRIVAA